MSLKATIQRLLSFGGSVMPLSEEFQQAIMTHVSLQGPTVLAEIGTRLFPMIEEDMRRYGLVEAAQILVNRGAISALRNGRPVDPVSADWTQVTVALKI